MSVLFIADDSLFPTNSGGRAEALGECTGLIQAGIKVRLLVSHRLDIPPADRERHRAIDPEAIFIKRASALSSSLRHPLSPYQLSSRVIGRAQVTSITSGPVINAVIASHEWTLNMGAKLAERLDAPLILRSHNDEVAYMNSLAGDAGLIRGAYYRAEAIRLKRLLPALMRKVDFAAVLSDADSSCYEALGVPTRLIPPVLTEVTHDIESPIRTPPDNTKILFVGSLDAPQAVQGLRWFIADVLPLVRKTCPEASLIVAGRRASPTLVRELSRSEGVEYLGEVSDLEPVMSSVRIFVNPVFGGSGVNMKVGPPSENGIPVVTTTIGARGLDAISGGLSVANTESGFAKICCDLLISNVLWIEKSRSLQQGIRSFTSMASGRAFAELALGISRR
ncbi:glycosyltransferase [Pseudarthrobacter sp. NBSH8]|uniref:glycosyltransferase n=1 Tax=Pseudarthrobacter sp. NBSH8 TaxID=2596911 RepID=UPI001626529C|nr:glycosyltransferase [Pseudarthrobacter sp. NBSH8]QNE15590.1 glycosyltransferase [Pseudarthrobacter sp. NBSH8]